MVPNKIVIAATGILASGALRIAYRRARRARIGIPALVALVACASTIAGVAWVMAASAIVAPLPDGPLRVAALGHPAPTMAGVLWHSAVLLCWSLLYLTLAHHGDLVAERERAERATAREQAARLEALRYQIGPHFLFNALNAASTLVVAGRNAEASRMISRLGDLLRLTLRSPSRPTVPLREELELVSRYVEVEEIRWGDRLSVSVDADDDALEAEVPPMLLQPLVENAVRYAVAARDEPARIAIEARRAGDRLRLSVADDGPGAPEGAGGMGVGLANVRERLRAAYGDEHRFEIGPALPRGVRVEIELPFAAGASPARREERSS